MGIKARKLPKGIEVQVFGFREENVLQFEPPLDPDVYYVGATFCSDDGENWQLVEPNAGEVYEQNRSVITHVDHRSGLMTVDTRPPKGWN